MYMTMVKHNTKNRKLRSRILHRAPTTAALLIALIQIILTRNPARGFSGSPLSSFHYLSSVHRSRHCNSRPRSLLQSSASQDEQNNELFFDSSSYESIESAEDAQAANTFFLYVLGLAPPILGFFLWGIISSGVALFFDNFAGFKAVDGGAFSSEILRPTINGIVNPAVSIVLGTLFATTVNVLWNRQLQLRTLINTEVGELRLLRRAIFGCFGTPQHCKRRAQAITLLKDYTNQLRTETQSGCIEKLTEIQRNVGISVNEIDELADLLHGVDGAAASRQNSVGAAEDLLVTLNGHRSERVATTLSGFPQIHWFLLIFLFGAINVSFFIDSNQGVLQYLNALQLRLFWSILLGVGSGAAVLLKGLADPFNGAFDISISAQQMEPFQQLLENDLQEAYKEARRVPTALIAATYGGGGEKQERPNYGMRNTILFHLLTGPWSQITKLFVEALSLGFRLVFRLGSRIKYVFRRKRTRSGTR